MSEPDRDSLWQKRVRDVLPGNFDSGSDAPGGAMAGSVAAMAALLGSIADRIDSAPDCLDPRRADERFLPLLARWVNLDWLLERDATGARRLRAGEGRLRELIATRAWCLRNRGRAEPLLLTLELATGLDGFGIEADTQRPQTPYCFVLSAPPLDATSRALVRLIVEREKPAYAAWRLVEAGGDRPEEDE